MAGKNRKARAETRTRSLLAFSFFLVYVWYTLEILLFASRQTALDVFGVMVNYSGYEL